MAITAFDVAIGTPDVWHPAEIVAADASRVPQDGISPAGREWCYWTVTAVEAGIKTTLVGRVLVAGPRAVDNPIGTLVVSRTGDLETYTRVKNLSEVIIQKADTLTVI